MLDQAFGQVYTKFKLHFYKQIFSRFEDREATLTTVESFCMEVITALGEPTIAQFSHMMNLSTPNAAYKINSLVKKIISIRAFLWMVSSVYDNIIFFFKYL